MIGQRVRGLRRPRIDDEVLRGERGELRADALSPARARDRCDSAPRPRSRTGRTSRSCSIRRAARRDTAAGTAAPATTWSWRAADRAAPTPPSRRCRCTPRVTVAPRRAQCRSAAAASRTSGLASALSSGPGILNPIAGTTTQSGVRPSDGRTGTPRPCEVLTVRRTPTIRTSNRGTASPGHLDQLVCRLKGVEDRGQPQVEHAVEREHIHPHGKNDIKCGVLAY